MKKFLLLLLCAGCGAVLAAEDDITFHGTLMSPPACSISGGQTIEVQFRDLIIDSIDGNYGRQEVDYDGLPAADATGGRRHQRTVECDVIFRRQHSPATSAQ